MSETKYCRLATVDTGDGVRVVKVDREVSVYEGDMVSINTDEIGTAIAVLFLQENEDTYRFISNLNPIYEATAVYRHAWPCEEESNAAP